MCFFCTTGDLQTAFSYAFANPHALTLMTIYTFLAYIAITFHMALVQEFGGITTGMLLIKLSLIILLFNQFIYEYF